MAQQKNNGIPWCDYTFNIVWGCQKVSEACESCYAEAFARRLGKDVWGPRAGRITMSDSYWQQPLKWNRKAEKESVRLKVFCSSMADVFEDHPIVDEQREKLWPLIKSTPNLNWLLLTKRAQRIAQSLPADWDAGYPNVWLGVTAENQRWYDHRWPYLRLISAAVRFISAEPLLGPISLHTGIQPDQIIIGGESGHQPRRMEYEWVRSIKQQCANSGAAFFMKQGSAANWPDYKNFDSFPPDLKVREFPGRL